MKERYWKPSLLIWLRVTRLLKRIPHGLCSFTRQGITSSWLLILDCSDEEVVLEILRQAAAYLFENGLVEAIADGFTQVGGALKATTLGKAIVTSALSIDEGLFVHHELERSMRGFILDDELVSLLQEKLTEASYISLYSSVRTMSSQLENSSE